jgi:uncharacterized membrane protein YsdA (DUF1294 family)
MIELNITPLQFALIVYLLAINLAAFIIYGMDKAKAGTIGARRISEKTLLILALVGGSLGSLLAMNIFRHKTKKLSFQAALAIVLAVQIGLIWLIFIRK